MKFKIFLIILTLFACGMAFADDAATYQTHELELKGSKIMVVEPDNWNKKLLIIAHGYRDASSPLHVNTYFDAFTQELIDDGWMIAATSYRRNGMIVRDAIEDLGFLCDYLDEKYGVPDERYLYGRSMGAKIGVLVAEQEDSGYQGVFAQCAGMGSEDPDNPLKVNYRPQVPIMFFQNNTEMDKSLDYIANVHDDAIKPVIWMVDRPGHCNTNVLENLEGFKAFLRICKGEKIEDRTLLIDMESTVVSEAKVEDGKMLVPLIPHSSSYQINIRKADFEKVGVEHKSWFKLTYKDKFYYVFYGDTYSDVPYLYWVGFFNADGTFKMARNFANAVSMLQYHEGDEVEISTIDEVYNIDGIYNQEAAELGVQAWNEVLAGNPEKAIELGKKAVAIEPDAVWLSVNLMHGYLFSGQYDKAKQICVEMKGAQTKCKQGYFEQQVLEDFEVFRQKGMEHPDLRKIEELLK